MASNNGVRIRLSFEEDGMLSEEQIEQGLNKSWYLVNPRLLTIGQLSAWITMDFRLGNSCPNGVTLEVRHFLKFTGLAHFAGLACKTVIDSESTNVDVEVAVCVHVIVENCLQT